MYMSPRIRTSEKKVKLLTQAHTSDRLAVRCQPRMKAQKNKGGETKKERKKKVRMVGKMIVGPCAWIQEYSKHPSLLI